MASVIEILHSEAELLGGDYGRVVLAGVSQGGATAAHVLLNLDLDLGRGGGGGKGLGGLMTFCSRFPYPGRTLRESREILGLERKGEGDDGGSGEEVVIRGTPVLWQHCVDDPLVRIEYGRQLRETLRAMGAKVEGKEYPVGGHWVQTPDGVDDAARWIRERVLGEK